MRLDRAPERESDAFGYVCGRCNRCCHDKGIQVNPYEVARLARACGQSAAEFRESSLDGVYLKRTGSGACVFLGPEGCTVHADRPLVCRVYPLARHIRHDGHVWFSTLDGHPQSVGRFTGEGTVADYLAGQGAAPFIRAADDYFFWWCRAADTLADGVEDADDEDAADWLDLDAAVERHSALTGAPVPDDLEQRRLLHLTILDELLSRRAAPNREGVDE